MERLLSVHATASIHIQILTCLWTRTGSNTMAWPLTSHILSSHLNICASAYLTWLNNDDGQCKTSCDRSWGSVNHSLDLLCAQRGVSRDKVNPFWTSGWVFIAVVIIPAAQCHAEHKRHVSGNVTSRWPSNHMPAYIHQTPADYQGFFIRHIIHYTGYNQKWNVRQMIIYIC